MKRTEKNCAGKLLAVLAFLSVFCLSQQGVAHDWPQWQGPNRDNSSAESGLLKSWPEEGPRQVWLSRDCGLGYAGPAIVEGRMYILGSREGVTELMCFDIEDGSEKWSIRIGTEYENKWGNGPRCTPTVDGEQVFALGGEGDLVCVRRSDGQELWRTSMVDLGGKVPMWGYSESVLVDGHRVLCTPGGSDGAIAALDRNTGKVLWQSPDLNDQAHYSSIMKTSPNGVTQYVQLLAQRLVGLAPDTGALLWEIPWDGRIAVIPTARVFDEYVYVTTGYGVGCMLAKFDAEGFATPVYNNKVMKNKHDGTVLIGENLYGYSDGVGWVCQNILTGERVWRERNALGKGSIGYADGMLYCLDQDDGIVALVKATPEGWNEVSRFTLSPQTELRKPAGRIWVHPVIVNGRLYLRDQELLFCFDVQAK